jgi:predicted DNA-binding transcriptional regulator AlpA
MRPPSKIVVVTPSAEIPETGHLSTTDLLGSARLSIKPIFAMSRTWMECAIESGRIPAPTIKLSSRFIAWDARVIKDFVQQLEAAAATESVL